MIHQEESDASFGTIYVLGVIYSFQSLYNPVAPLAHTNPEPVHIQKTHLPNYYSIYT
jgi:hypothetical protein